MSELARANGWRGFDNIGDKVEKGEFGHGPARGGWLYRCNGMPRPMGCGNEIITTRRLARIGKKPSGWLVCYGQDFDGTEDVDVVLTFCPSCALTVASARGVPTGDNNE